MTIVGIGLIGCGRIAEVAWVPAIERLPDVRMAAVCDLDAGRAAALGAPAYSDPRELVASGDVDAIVVASPAASHLELARLASDAGKPAIVEKPPAATVADARALTDLEHPPWIAFNRRFDPRLEPLLDARPTELPLRFDADFGYRRSGWGAHDPGGDDALLDLGSHVVDLALVVLGPGETRVRTTALTGSRARVEIETDRGHANLAVATDRRWREHVALRDAAFLVGRSRRGGITDLVRSAGARVTTEHPLITSVSAQLTAFVAGSRGGDPGRLATAADGARVMAVIEAARESFATGGDWTKP